MALGPLLRWRRDQLRALARRLALPLLLAAAALLATILIAPGIDILPLLGLVFAAGVGAASLAPLWKRNLRRTPLFTWGMVIAHLGVAVSVAGMASESAFTKETLVSVRPGEMVAVGGWGVRLEKVEPIAGPNWTAVQGTLTATPDGVSSYTLTPQARAFWAPPTETNESAILSRWNGQLYTVLGHKTEDGRWQLRLWWKPFVTLIWAGGALIALGGALALIGRLRREHRAAVREVWA